MFLLLCQYACTTRLIAVEENMPAASTNIPMIMLAAQVGARLTQLLRIILSYALFDL